MVNYIRTILGLGVGTSNLAYAPDKRLPILSVYNLKYNVRNQLNPTAPAYFKPSQIVPQLPIEGNGLALQGQLALQALHKNEPKKAN